MQCTPCVNPDAMATVFGLIFVIAIMAFTLIAVIIQFWLYFRVFKKAGFHWALCFLLLAPFGNLILNCILAFGSWPVLKELEALRNQAAGQQGIPTDNPQE